MKHTIETVMGSTSPLLGMVFDQFPMAVTVTDAKGHIVYCNQMQLELDGYRVEDVIGRFLLDLYSPFTNSVVLPCLEAKKPIINHWQVYHSKKRNNIHTNRHAFPLFQEGRLTGCIAFSKSYLKTEYENYFHDRHSEPKDVSPGIHFGNLIGRSPSFQRAIQIAKAAAGNHLPVLIHGETGVGKELFAKGIHNESNRHGKPFVAVNCSAIPDELFEGLMFGVAKGAFTGAVERQGFFEEANYGTIYLDEIDSMPLALQPKLLRVLQEGEVRRLGSSADIKLDVKVISSMTKNPLSMTRRDLFRSDLFFRLGALLIPIPPLRERPGDLVLLLTHFIAKHSAALGKQIKRASPDCVELLHESEWLGNVRELEHIITHAIAMAKPRRLTLGVDLLPEYFNNVIFSHNNLALRLETDIPPALKVADQLRLDASSNSSTLNRIMGTPLTGAGHPGFETDNENLSLSWRKIRFKEEEKNTIEATLKKTFGNVALAARFLGLAPQILHYKIKKYGIDSKAIKELYKRK